MLMSQESVTQVNLRGGKKSSIKFTRHNICSNIIVGHEFVQPWLAVISDASLRDGPNIFSEITVGPIYIHLTFKWAFFHMTWFGRIYEMI